MSSIYDIPFQAADGNTSTLDEYRGQVILIVNTATKCGLATQFDGLEKLWQEHRDQGLVVIGFPCNQFAGQETVSDSDMASTCKLNHGVTFPLMARIHVNGRDTHPLYQHLKSQKGRPFFRAIKWNFAKFLIDRNGKVVKRFSPVTTPKKIRRMIEKVL